MYVNNNSRKISLAVCFISLFMITNGDIWSRMVSDNWDGCSLEGPFSSQYGFCVDGLFAEGPFTFEMMSNCLLLPICNPTTMCLKLPMLNAGILLPKIPLQQAINLRGNDPFCLSGSSRDSNFNGYCVEQYTQSGVEKKFVYGPFPRNLISLCYDRGGGLECFTNKWVADFYLFLISLNSTVTYCDDNKDGIFDCFGWFSFLFFQRSFPLILISQSTSTHTNTTKTKKQKNKKTKKQKNKKTKKQKNKKTKNKKQNKTKQNKTKQNKTKQNKKNNKNNQIFHPCCHHNKLR